MPEQTGERLYARVRVVHQMFVSQVVQFTHLARPLTQSELSDDVYAEREIKQHTHSFLIYCNERA